jgi:hypothetical protein
VLEFEGDGVDPSEGICKCMCNRSCVVCEWERVLGMWITPPMTPFNFPSPRR